jgi:hypothetical protein
LQIDHKSGRFLRNVVKTEKHSPETALCFSRLLEWENFFSMFVASAGPPVLVMPSTSIGQRLTFNHARYEEIP